MREKIVFEADWLSERYPFDVQARSKILEAKCIELFADKESLFLLDIGAGTGNNCKYLMERFPQNQDWILVEHDAALCRKSIAALQQWAVANNYPTRVNEAEVLSIKIGAKNITIRCLNASLLAIADLIELEKIDLISNNAVFDLFTKTQFAQWIAPIAKAQTAFFSTINYTGMRFSPESPQDVEMIALYEAHMERVQACGQKGMGKQCANVMQEQLRKKNANISSADSVWQIKETDSTMLYFLIYFMEEALNEMNLTAKQQTILKEWLSQKRQNIEQEKLCLTVIHQDILAHF